MSRIKTDITLIKLYDYVNEGNKVFFYLFIHFYDRNPEQNHKLKLQFFFVLI